MRGEGRLPAKLSASFILCKTGGSHVRTHLPLPLAPVPSPAPVPATPGASTGPPPRPSSFCAAQAPVARASSSRACRSLSHPQEPVARARSLSLSLSLTHSLTHSHTHRPSRTHARRPQAVFLFTRARAAGGALAPRCPPPRPPCGQRRARAPLSPAPAGGARASDRQRALPKRPSAAPRDRSAPPLA
jgi:hypothetical protein